MIGQTVSHYRVLEEIGAGGMGTVYRAEDTRLGRHVALKCLSAEISADPYASARLRREAETVSSLSHPHICALFDVVDDGDRLCLIFELVEGRSLKDEIARRPMPPARVLSLAIQLADALDAAHARGVIHRDVKPANVIINARGDAKLLDFGVATLGAQDAETNRTRTRLTVPGGSVGTPGYMAPEQLRGETVDVRIDIFAMGALLHEALTGHAAFAGASDAEVIDAVLNHTPPSATHVNPAVPAELSRIVTKALDKDPDLRHQSARDLLADLRRLALDGNRVAGTERGRSRGWPRWAIGIAATAVIAVIAVVGWSMRNRSAPPAIDASASTDGQARLVVLPFENLTRQADDDWLAGAFADSVSAGLQAVDSLILVPRERIVEIYASESRRESEPLSADLARQLSQRLRVRYYVHGSYQKVGNDIRVVARLVDVAADAIRAQDTLNGAFADILELEERLAGRLATQFAPNPGGPAVRAAGTSNLVAYQRVSEARGLYALGRYAEARALLVEATTLDPRYALAWAMLSKTEARSVSPAVAAERPSQATLQRAHDYAQRAVELDPSLAESHIAVALAFRGVSDRPHMREAALRAVAIDGKLGEPRIILGDALSISPAFTCPVNADGAAAEAAFLDALRIDPITASGYMNMTTNRWWMGRRVEALEPIETALSIQPQNVLLQSTRPFNLLFAGRVDEAEGIMNDRQQRGRTLTALETVTLGYLALARRRFDDAIALFGRDDVVRMMGNHALRLITATAFFEAARPAEGAALLAQAVRLDPGCRQWAQQVPVLAPYRQTPEFIAALRAGK